MLAGDLFMPSTDSTSPLQLLLIFLRLGLTSFGGPVAHLGYFRDEFVVRRRWLDEAAYADLVALCQFLPGPASSQVGMAIGMQRAGQLGALAAWLGFTLPSALLMLLLGLGLSRGAQHIPAGLLHGLKLVAVAVVIQAVWGMWRSLCPDSPRRGLMLLGCAISLLLPGLGGQFMLLYLCAAGGLLLCREHSHTPDAPSLDMRQSLPWLAGFLVLLTGLPLLARLWPGAPLELVSGFYQAGALVFGGGHVVLPLLQEQVVDRGWLSQDLFMAGYAAAQAVPGPLFTFAAFLGAASQGVGGWLGGTLALLAIFLPSWLLVAGGLPLWTHLRQHMLARAAMAGLNAGVVGLLLATLYQPLWRSSVSTALDALLVLLAFMLLTQWQRPAWQVLLLFALLGAVC